ncbi:hypothetical protein KFU94_51195 [Chloroflexi bacterium TSY]|nr:hypothetical protein [Chloroflexi bacterium TSY]
MRTFAYVGLWFIFSALIALTGWIVYTAILNVSSFIIETPALKPLYWSQDTLSPISRLSIFVIGSLCLIMMLWSEGYLRNGLNEGQLKRHSIRLALWIAGVLFVSYGLILLT